MRPSLFLVPTVLVIALAAACQPGNTADDTASRASNGAEEIVRYQCGDKAVQATFRGQGSATVVIDGRTHAMTGEQAASGARYVDTRGNVLWTKGGDQAVLALQGEENRQCTAAGAGAGSAAVAAPSSFRAAGNEPGWLVRVNAEGQSGLHVEVDYGQTVYDVPAPTQGPDGWAGTATDGTLVKLSIERVPCQDVSSGRTFEAKAMLAVGARQLHGCGSFLAAR